MSTKRWQGVWGRKMKKDFSLIFPGAVNNEGWMPGRG
jgi:hypothetical protein